MPKLPPKLMVDAEVVRNPWGDDRPLSSSSPNFQFTLGSLFILMTVFAFLVAIGNFGVQTYGARAAVSSLLLLMVGLITLTIIGFTWGIFYYFFPQPTKYASVLGLFVLLPLSMLPCWLIQSREAARRTQCLNNMGKIGSAVQNLTRRSDPEALPYENLVLQDHHQRPKSLPPVKPPALYSPGLD